MKISKIMLAVLACYAFPAGADPGDAGEAVAHAESDTKKRIVAEYPYFGISVGVPGATLNLRDATGFSGTRKLKGELAFSAAFGRTYEMTDMFFGWEIDYSDFGFKGRNPGSKFYGVSAIGRMGFLNVMPWMNPYFGAGMMAFNHEFVLGNSATLVSKRALGKVFVAGVNFGRFDDIVLIDIEYRRMDGTSKLEGVVESGNRVSAFSLRARFVF
jgi:hypothetical protein